jgi:hypothetical protein
MADSEQTDACMQRSVCVAQAARAHAHLRPDLTSPQHQSKATCKAALHQRAADSICAAFSDRPETLAVLGKKTCCGASSHQLMLMVSEFRPMCVKTKTKLLFVKSSILEGPKFCAPLPVNSILQSKLCACSLICKVQCCLCRFVPWLSGGSTAGHTRLSNLCPIWRLAHRSAMLGAVLRTNAGKHPHSL